MSCIASAVRRVIAAGSTLRNVPSSVSTVSTPSVVTSRYWVVSGPSGRSSVNSFTGSTYRWVPLRAKIGAVTDNTSTTDTIVGLSFGDVFRAQEFLTATYRMVANSTIELIDAVIIVKSPDGKTMVRETTDPTPATQALTGGMWAGLFGLILAGPVGWLAGTAVGAGAGAVRGKLVDIGIPDEWVAWFRDAVQPGTATVVLMLGQIDDRAVFAELERFAGARLVYANVPPDVVQRIRDAIEDPSTGPLTQEEQEATTAAGASEGAELPPPTGPPSTVDPSTPPTGER